MGKSNKNQEEEISHTNQASNSSTNSNELSCKKDWILAGKIKSAYCEGCNQFVPRVFVGEWKPSDRVKEEDDLLDIKVSKKDKKKKEQVEPNDAENQYWLKCPNCNQVQLVSEWQIQIDRQTKLEELKPDDCAKYFPQGLYAEGDAVFHPTLNDVGIVRTKQSTASGANVIIVEFQNSGKKQLLENVQVNSDGSSRAVTKKGKVKLKIKKS